MPARHKDATNELPHTSFFRLSFCFYYFVFLCSFLYMHAGYEFLSPVSIAHADVEQNSPQSLRRRFCSQLGSLLWDLKPQKIFSSMSFIRSAVDDTRTKLSPTYLRKVSLKNSTDLYSNVIYKLSISHWVIIGTCKP